MNRVKKVICYMVLTLVIGSSCGLLPQLRGEAKEITSVGLGCAVPLPDSKPGEEKKDMLSAVIGLGVLTIIVCGGIVFLKKNYSDKND